MIFFCFFDSICIFSTVFVNEVTLFKTSISLPLFNMEGFTLLREIVDSGHVRWSFDSYLRGYHAYLDVWVPMIGDNSLVCHKEVGNVRDAHAVANVVGHVPQNLCGFWRFLTLPGTSIRAEVLGTRVNRGAGHGLEVPVRFIFQGHRKAVEWVQKKIKTADNDIQERFKRCMKNAT